MKLKYDEPAIEDFLVGRSRGRAPDLDPDRRKGRRSRRDDRRRNGRLPSRAGRRVVDSSLHRLLDASEWGVKEEQPAARAILSPEGPDTNAAASNSLQRASRLARASASTPQRSAWKSSSTCAARQLRGVRRHKLARHPKRKQRRPGQCGHCAERGERNRIVKSGTAARTAAIELRRLLDMHDPGAGIEVRAECLRRPGEDGVEGEPLAFGQLLRLFSSVAEEIGARISRTSARVSAIGATPSTAELRSRVSGMSAGSIVSRCRLPFGRDDQHERPALRRQRVTARRPGEAAVERQDVRPPAASRTSTVSVKGLIAIGACSPGRRASDRAAGPLIGRVLDRDRARHVEAEHREAMSHVLRQGAVTSIIPPRGWGSTKRRARRCSLGSRPRNGAQRIVARRDRSPGLSIVFRVADDRMADRLRVRAQLMRRR